MSEFDALIKELTIPKQLKEYLTNSKYALEYLNEQLLNDIEELYVYYLSLYTIDNAQFSEQVIMTLKRTKDLDSYYFYLKKVLDTNLLLGERETNIYKDSKDYINIEQRIFDDILRGATSNFIRSIDRIYNSEKNIDMEQTYKFVGKLELINDLVDDKYYEGLLDSGNKVIDRFKQRHHKQ